MSSPALENTSRENEAAGRGDDQASYAPPRREADDFQTYRTVSRAAIFSVVTLVVGLMGLLFSALLVLPLAGALLAYSAIRTIGRYPEEYSGLGLAKWSLGLNLLLFFGGASKHTIEYVTEVPEGFERISFSELQPDGFNKTRLIPERAMKLNDKPVFIKGYIHPGVDGMGRVKEFVLVPDMGTCCFGGQPKLTDMVLVHTDDKSRLEYRRHVVKLAGKFKIGDRLANLAGVNGVLYRLEATYSQ